jgi:hypothetical protein
VRSPEQVLVGDAPGADPVGRFGTEWLFQLRITPAFSNPLFQ